ncbi:MAG: hypothetical protein WBH00_13600 [Xanthobacteraceae bacterium]
MSVPIDRRVVMRMLAAVAVIAVAGPVIAAEQPQKLFSIVTVKDQIVVGLTRDDGAMATDVGEIGKALRRRGSMSFWRYAVRKGKDGELEHAPLAKISVLANDSLRIEPYATPLRVMLSVGGIESGEFQRQERDFADAWRKAGLRCEIIRQPEGHHFDMIEYLIDRNGALYSGLKQLINN